MANSQRKRGRPATIDTQSAMQSVVELFRAKGYAAVSLDDLSDATGLSRPSLYRSFGNKLSMYVAAMNAFGDQVREEAVPALLAPGRLEDALSNFYQAMLTIYYRDDEVSPGCLVYATAPSSAHEEEIQDRLRFGVESTDSIMRQRIQTAAPEATSHQIETAAHIGTNTLIAFSARAKSGASKSELVDMGARSAKAISAVLGLSEDPL
ncbi:MAG: TetR/AcrR family transcriptional regulator [Pseudomonadota bacterium]